MATAELTKPATFEIQPITFEATAEALEQLVAKSCLLVVTGVDDTDGIAAVREHRLELKKIRVNIENRRKQLKADSLEYGRQVDGMAKALTAIIEPEEKRLEYQEGVVKRHQEKLAREAEERRQEKLKARLQRLVDVECSLLPTEVEALSDADFAALVEKKRGEMLARKAEQERIAAEQKAEAESLAAEKAEFAKKQAEIETRNKRGVARLETLAQLGHPRTYTIDQLADMEAEDWKQLNESAMEAKSLRDEALREEQARLDQQRKEQEAAQAKIDAENKRLRIERGSNRAKTLMAIGLKHWDLFVPAAEELCDLTLAEFEDLKTKLQKVKADEDEKARLDEIARQEQAAADAKAKAEAEATEAARLEALKPDHEKLAALADQVLAIKVPEVSDEAQAIAQQIADVLRHCANDIRGFAGELLK